MSQFLVFILVIVIFVGLVSAAPVSSKNLKDYNFERYLEDFSRYYSSDILDKSSAEHVIRKKLFEHELARVIEHNSRGLTWTETVNKFSAMTADEKKSYFGLSKGAMKYHKPKYEIPADMSQLSTPVSKLPTQVDWRETGIISAVKDQGQCGSCWAFGSIATIESHVAKETGLLFDLSVQQMAMCAPNPDHCGGDGGCAGSTPELAFDYVAGSKGLYEEYQYGYISYFGQDYTCQLPRLSRPVATIAGYVHLPQNNYEAVMNAVATVGPIAISVDASTWHAYESGIYNGCNGVNPEVDHVVGLVGYGEDSNGKYWLVRNSWSPAWGEKGYIRIARSDNDNEVCGEDLVPQDGVACAGENDPVTVCGTCAVIYDTAYPVGAKLV